MLVSFLAWCTDIVLPVLLAEDIISINVPLILKVWDIIFFSQAKHISGHFAGFFEGAETFLTLKLS